MVQRFLNLTSLIATLALVSTAQGNMRSPEPAYCNPDNFLANEKTVSVPNAQRLKLFKIGKLTLVGAGIGNSDVNALVNLADSRATFARSDKYCTWYFNEGNEQAEQRFNHIYLPYPIPIPSVVVQQYESLLTDTFATSANNFVSCATNSNYIALGCNGMRHRGPTAFAMLLAFSGCSPENSATIANRAWGLNFILPASRLSVARKGYELGTNNPQARRALQEIMTAAE